MSDNQKMFLKVTIPLNWVLIDTNMFDNSVMLADKVRIEIDPTYEPQDWITRVGIALVVPRRLTFDDTLSRASLEWKTTVEILPGDKVYFDYFGALMSFGRRAQEHEKNTEELTLGHEGRVFPFIHYRELFAYEREGEFVPINGHVIIEQIEKVPRSKLAVFDHRRNEVDTLKGVVKYVGKCNERYLNSIYQDAAVEVGDTVLWKNYANRPIKVNGVNMWAVQRRYIEAKFTGFESHADLQKATSAY